MRRTRAVAQSRLVLEPDGWVREIQVEHPVNLLTFGWSVPTWLRSEIGWPVRLDHAPFFCCLWWSPGGPPNELATSLARLTGSAVSVSGRAVLAGGGLLNPESPVDEAPPPEMIERLTLIGVSIKEG